MVGVLKSSCSRLLVFCRPLLVHSNGSFSTTYSRIKEFLLPETIRKSRTRLFCFKGKYSVGSMIVNGVDSLSNGSDVEQNHMNFFGSPCRRERSKLLGEDLVVWVIQPFYPLLEGFHIKFIVVDTVAVALSKENVLSLSRSRRRPCRSRELMT